MSETYPRKNLCETLFAGHTPSSVGIVRKGSEKFADVQIFQLKVYGLKFIVKDLPEWDSSSTPRLMDKEWFYSVGCRAYFSYEL